MAWVVAMESTWATESLVPPLEASTPRTLAEGAKSKEAKLQMSPRMRCGSIDGRVLTSMSPTCKGLGCSQTPDPKMASHVRITSAPLVGSLGPCSLVMWAM